jgi:hypothetical protein
MLLGLMNVGDNDDAILILHWMHTGMLLLVPKYNEWCTVFEVDVVSIAVIIDPIINIDDGVVVY